MCGSGALCDDCFGTGDRLTTYRVGDSRLATRYIALLRAYGVTCVYQPEGATDTETSGDGPKVGECVGVYELVRIVRLEVKTEITEHPAK